MCNTSKMKGDAIMFGKKARKELVTFGNLVEGVPVPQKIDAMEMIDATLN